MFNKNVFTQTDTVADLIKGINEADYKAKMEALKGNQHKIDKNKNGKVDAHDFKLLRGEKKTVDEGSDSKEKPKVPTNNPFDVKNYKPQIDFTKPGEKAGFDSKKISTGTVYTKKYAREEVEKKKETTPFDPPFDADPVKKNPSAKAGKYGLGYSTAKNLAQQGMKQAMKSTKEEVELEDIEQLDEKNSPTNPALWSRAKSLARSKFDVYPSAYANGWASKWYKSKGGSWKSVKEEVEQMDEELLDERSLSADETSEKERIVKGMKKSLSGFKARYGDKAKSVMYATATKSAKKD